MVYFCPLSACNTVQRRKSPSLVMGLSQLFLMFSAFLLGLGS
ncbi:hypothetical protein KEJ52_03070 [Candidatus Bathyarchaeota archaeon]|nr:hypothetical protein [Candidatus Bathyarchaeota archaeon]